MASRAPEMAKKCTWPSEAAKLHLALRQQVKKGRFREAIQNEEIWVSGPGCPRRPKRSKCDILVPKQWISTILLSSCARPDLPIHGLGQKTSWGTGSHTYKNCQKVCLAIRGTKMVFYTDPASHEMSFQRGRSFLENLGWQACSQLLGSWTCLVKLGLRPSFFLKLWVCWVSALLSGLRFRV